MSIPGLLKPIEGGHGERLKMFFALPACSPWRILLSDAARKPG